MPTPKKVRFIGVPSVVERYSHNGHHTLARTDRRRYEVSREDLHKMPGAAMGAKLCANHEGPQIGVVTKAWIHNNQLHCEGELDDSMASMSTRKRIAAGAARCVSMQHNPVTGEIQEFSFCQVPQREGSNITDILVSACAPPGTSKDDSYNLVTVHEDAQIHFVQAAQPPSSTMATLSVQELEQMLLHAKAQALLAQNPAVPPPSQQHPAVAFGQHQQLQQQQPSLTNSILHNASPPQQQPPVQQQQQPPQQQASAPGAPPPQQQQPPATGAGAAAAAAATAVAQPPPVNGSEDEFNAWLASMQKVADVLIRSRSTPEDEKRNALLALSQTIETAKKRHHEAASATAAKSQAIGERFSIEQKLKDANERISQMEKERENWRQAEVGWMVNTHPGTMGSPAAALAATGMVAAGQPPPQQTAPPQAHYDADTMASYQQFLQLTQASRMQPVQQVQYQPPPQHHHPVQYLPPQQQQQSYSLGPPQFTGQYGGNGGGESLFHPDTGFVKASVPPEPEYYKTAEPNLSVVRFRDSVGWDRINRIHPMAARMLNNSSSPVTDFDSSKMVYQGSKYQPNATSDLRGLDSRPWAGAV